MNEENEGYITDDTLESLEMTREQWNKQNLPIQAGCDTCNKIRQQYFDKDTRLMTCYFCNTSQDV